MKKRIRSVISQIVNEKKQKPVKVSITDVVKKQATGGPGHEVRVANENDHGKTQVYTSGSEVNVTTRIMTDRGRALVPRPVPGNIRTILVVAAEAKNQTEARLQTDRVMERKRRRRKIKTGNEVAVTVLEGIGEVETGLRTDGVKVEVGPDRHIPDATSLSSLLSSMAERHSTNSSFRSRIAPYSTNGLRLIRRPT